jgi:hypothetical protein
MYTSQHTQNQKMFYFTIKKNLLLVLHVMYTQYVYYVCTHHMYVYVVPVHTFLYLSLDCISI